MRFFHTFFLLLLAPLLHATTDGLTDVVTWDPFSLEVNGERVFIFAGEFHYERLPVPELWLDIFQKFKANGLNAFFWSYHSAAKGVYDFETAGKNVQLLLDMASDAGLYVIARPGPYSNAETNAGGFALWTSDGSGGKYRTSDETYHQAWLPWMNEINAIIAKNQITQGGPVILYQIENELVENSHVATNTRVLYMEQIENATRTAGIVVPFTSNEKGMRAESWFTDYQNVGGAVNIYGLDSYPGGLSCSNPDSGFNVQRTYYQWFQSYSPTQPAYFPEFQGGQMQAWGGSFYDDCTSNQDPAFADVFYKNNIAQRTTLMSLYMAYGGTNWGNLAAPVVYTSYDYAAPLRETREIQNKFRQIKLIGLFTRASQDLLAAKMESNGTGNAVNTTDIWTWVLRNPSNNAGFYTVQHSTSSSRAVTPFTITLNTTAGQIQVANTALNGRQSKIIVTDYHFGSHTLLYSTADVLTYGVFQYLFSSQTVIALYLQQGQTGEFAFHESATLKSTTGSTKVTKTAHKGTSSTSYASYIYVQGSGSTVLTFSNNLTVLLLDIPTAWSFFAPPTTTDRAISAKEQTFVIGPYLVRNATVSGTTLSVVGDSANATTIEAWVGNSFVSTIKWNGKSLTTKKTSYGSLTASLTGASSRTVTLPDLTSWKVADSLPEASRDYDDSNWVICNKTTTLSPIKPLTLPVLFSSDYGYYAGQKIYRGYFNGKTATSANITAQNGFASGWSAWLNGHLVGGSPGDASLSATSDLLDFTGVTLYTTNNVLTVVVDYTGHDETSTGQGAENPRGLLGAVLYAGTSTLKFTEWKIAGNAGGSTNIDAVRGPMNEGGLYGERLGWHLPGFSPSGSAWSTGSPTAGLASSGIKWYVTNFTLAFDADLDVPIGLELGASATTVARVQIYVNGYQYGKYVPHIGPQTRFPFPPGVVNNRGANTLAISLWAQNDDGAKLDTVKLVKYGVYESGFGFSRDWSYLQPGWDSGRLAYA